MEMQTSDTHRIMIEMLAKAAFVTQEFILSPLQFGVPYSRPRYFCLVALSLPVCVSHARLCVSLMFVELTPHWCIII